MWLLLQNIYDDMQAARATSAGFSAEQIAAHEQRIDALDTTRVMAVAGDSAEIQVKGVLTNAPDMFARWFGGGNTTYPEINAALAEADANPEVKEIVMRFASGGGSVDGMFGTIAAMKATKKPIRAIVDGLAASAAYALLAQADEVEAVRRDSEVGNLGAAIETALEPRMRSITNSESPNKRPDLTTQAGEDIVVRRLDGIYDLFAEAIADGRGTTVKKVNADFGRGEVLLADEALKRGMIDKIAAPAVQSSKHAKSTTASGGNLTEASTMDITELKAKHPTLCAQLVADGTEQERDRVSAHLTMGAASGSMDIAIKAIEEGKGMTASLNAKYMAAGMNKQSVADRGADNPGDLGTGDDPAEKGQEADAKASADILAAAFAKCGVEMEA